MCIRDSVTRTVDASWSHVDQTVTISIDDRELVTTVDHRFWSQSVGAFVPAGDLEVGDKVVGDHGRVHTVTRTAEVGGYERVWNLSIDQVHTYHVGDTDTLVHNNCRLFVVKPSGETVVVPNGARGPFPAKNGKGVIYVGGKGGPGLHPRVTDVRIMQPGVSGKRYYPRGYVTYSADGQPVDPFTGRTLREMPR